MAAVATGGPQQKTYGDGGAWARVSVERVRVDARASRIQYKMACHHLRGHADRQARPSQDVLALSRLAAVFNSVMLSFPVVGVVNNKLRTVRARRSSGSAPYGTSRASPMLPGRASFRRASTCQPPSRAGAPPPSSRRPSRRHAASVGDLKVEHH